MVRCVRFALVAVVQWALLSCDNSPSGLSVPRPGEVIPGDVKPNTASWDLSRVVPLDSVRAMPAGAEMFVRTEFASGELVDLQVKLVGVVDDLMPPLPYIMLEASDSLLVNLKGVAEGMSGSPVFTEEGTVGALSIGFDAQVNPPFYFFATPIEAMLSGIIRNDLPAASAKPKVWHGHRVLPLAVQLVGTGVSSRLSQRLLKQLEGAGTRFNVSYAAAGLADNLQSEFVPGRPLAAAVIWGDEVNITSVGTITYTAGSQVLGFGHSMFNTGDVGLPIVEARVLQEISGLISPYKFFTVGRTVRGTLMADRPAGVGGTIGGATLEGIPLNLEVKMPNGSSLTLHQQMASKGVPGFLQGECSGVTFFSPLVQRLDDAPDQSLRVKTHILFKNSPLELNQVKIFTDANTHISGFFGIIVSSALDNYVSTYSTLIAHPDVALEPSLIKVVVEVVDSVLTAKIQQVSADTIVAVGGELNVQVLLRVARREDREVNFLFAIPDTFKAGIYDLAVAGSDLFEPDSLINSTLVVFSDDADYQIGKLFEDLNREDLRTTLKARLLFSEPEVAGPDMTDQAVVLDSLGSESPPDFLEIPPEVDTPPMRQFISLTRDLGLVLSGYKYKRIHIKKPQP